MSEERYTVKEIYTSWNEYKGVDVKDNKHGSEKVCRCRFLKDAEMIAKALNAMEGK